MTDPAAPNPAWTPNPAPSPAPSSAPSPAPSAGPGSDPTTRLQAELTQMSGSSEGLLALAAIATLATYAVFNVALEYGAVSWGAVVAAALILLARFMPASPAGGLSGKTAQFALGFVVVAFAALALIADVRSLHVPGPIPLLGEVCAIAAGAIAGFALFRMMK